MRSAKLIIFVLIIWYISTSLMMILLFLCVFKVVDLQYAYSDTFRLIHVIGSEFTETGSEFTESRSKQIKFLILPQSRQNNFLKYRMQSKQSRNNSLGRNQISNPIGDWILRVLKDYH